MKKMKFWKMSGAGNDFVVLASSLGGQSLPKLAQRLCDRRHGIGADGLLALDKKGLRFNLRYYNADGSAAFCGNGSRCGAWWMHEQGWTRGQKLFEFNTNVGPLTARITDVNRAAIHMPSPRAWRMGVPLSLPGQKLIAHAVNTGVPHAVIETSRLDAIPVAEEGRLVRRHKAFAPAGVNADFVTITPKGILLRTYERGVEDETLACGTGVVASALVAARLKGARSPVCVRVLSGDTLNVSFIQRGEEIFDDVWLEGPARVVFTGEVSL